MTNSGCSKKQKCPHCGGKNTKKNGVRRGKRREVQRYFCNDCKKAFDITAKKCPYCGGKNTKKNGTRNDIQRYVCNGCKRSFCVFRKGCLDADEVVELWERKENRLNSAEVARILNTKEYKIKQEVKKFYKVDANDARGYIELKKRRREELRGFGMEI